MVMHAVFFYLKWVSQMATVVYSNKGPDPSSQEIKHHRAAAESNCLLFFFEGSGPHRDKRIQSVILGHFLFTPSCCSHNRCIKMICRQDLIGLPLQFVFFLHMWKVSQNGDVKMLLMHQTNSQIWHPEQPMFYPSRTGINVREQV